MRALALVIAFLASALTHADEGEVYVGADVGLGAAWLRHPLAPASLFVDEHTGLATAAEGRVLLRYGLTNELHLGAALDAGASTNIVTHGVSLAGASGDLVTGAYVDVATPFAVGWRYDSGLDVAGVAEVEAGPLLVLWSATAFADPTRPDGRGRPTRFPVPIDDVAELGFVARVRLGVELRFLGGITVSTGLEGGASYAGSPAFFAGAFVRPSLALPLGPP